jgi:glycine hydroxymethyltransferase
LNKNAVAGDSESLSFLTILLLITASALVPGGVRVGTSALTSRSMTEKDVEQVAEFLHRVVQISLTTQKEAGTKLLKDFTKTFESGSGEAPKLIAELKKDVMKFATSFPLPGIPDTVGHPDLQQGRLLMRIVQDCQARGC